MKSNSFSFSVTKTEKDGETTRELLINEIPGSVIPNPYWGLPLNANQLHELISNLQNIADKIGTGEI